MSDRIVAVLLFILVLVFGIQAWFYVPESYTDILGARAFPLTIALFMLPLTVSLFLGKRTARVWPDRHTWTIVAIALGALIVYGLIINYLGFFIATTGIFVVYGGLYRVRFWKTLLAGMFSSLALYALFVWTLDMYLPVGKLFEEIF